MTVLNGGAATRHERAAFSQRSKRRHHRMLHFEKRPLLCVLSPRRSIWEQRWTLCLFIRKKPNILQCSEILILTLYCCLNSFCVFLKELHMLDPRVDGWSVHDWRQNYSSSWFVDMPSFFRRRNDSFFYGDCDAVNNSVVNLPTSLPETWRSTIRPIWLQSVGVNVPMCSLQVELLQFRVST